MIDIIGLIRKEDNMKYLIIISLCMLFMAVSWPVGLIRDAKQNDFAGKIVELDRGAYAITVEGKFIGDTNLKHCYPFYLKPKPMTDAGEQVSGNCLFEDNSYILYEKTFTVLWKYHSYFVEPVCKP